MSRQWRTDMGGGLDVGASSLAAGIGALEGLLPSLELDTDGGALLGVFRTRDGRHGRCNNGVWGGVGGREADAVGR